MPDTRTDELAQLFGELIEVLRTRFVDGGFSPLPTAIKLEFARDLDGLERRAERVRERVST
jgi:hypothetical protein